MLARDVLNVVCELRRQRKLTCEDVAGAIGYKTGKGYRDVEIGKTELTVNHVLKLSSFYNVPVGIFFAHNATKMEEVAN